MNITGVSKIYLETTIFNRYFEEGREYCAETRQMFDMIAGGAIDAFTSAYVLEELDPAPEPKRGRMISLIKKYDLAVLKIDRRARDLADVYVEMGVIPAKYVIDGVHIAMAAVHGADCIVSLNFHHINKLRTKTSTDIINRMKGYSSPFICTPMEVIDYGE